MNVAISLNLGTVVLVLITSSWVLMVNFIRSGSVMEHSDIKWTSSSTPFKHNGHDMDVAPILLFNGNILVRVLKMMDAMLLFSDSMYCSLVMVCLNEISNFNFLSFRASLWNFLLLYSVGSFLVIFFHEDCDICSTSLKVIFILYFKKILIFS